MAGQTIIGLISLQFWLNFLMSQHRQMSVNKLSDIPEAILAKELALRGAISSPSAHFLNSICRTGSPLFCQDKFSSSSLKIGVWQSVYIFSKTDVQMNFQEDFVKTSLMLKKEMRELVNQNILIAATDPVIAMIRFFFKGSYCVYYFISIYKLLKQIIFTKRQIVFGSQSLSKKQYTFAQFHQQSLFHHYFCVLDAVKYKGVIIQYFFISINQNVLNFHRGFG